MPCPLPRPTALFVAALCVLASKLPAAIQVTQNYAPTPSAWSGSPLVASMTNPSSEGTLAEDFQGGGGCSSLGQTFTLPAGANYRLDSLELLVGGGLGSSESRPLALALYDLGAIDAATLSDYTGQVSLLNSGAPLPIHYSSQTKGLLKLTFTDTDRIFLQSNHVYVLELSGLKSTSPMSWYRSSTNTLADGVAYRSRALLNSNNARDYALALYATTTSEAIPASHCSIDNDSEHQRIDGFGAGVVFLDGGLSPLSSGQMDFLYGTEGQQAGLTLLRTRIAPYGDWSSAVADAKAAHERGARILATPWTPPAYMKSNNHTVGGSLLAAQYDAYAHYLNNFAIYMREQGAPISVVSIQNEPDYQVSYESCDWTAEQVRSFMANHAQLITEVPVMIPESFAFIQGMSDATLNDPQAAANVGYIGGHLYGTSIQDYPLAHSLNKPVWMTEYLINDQSVESSIGTGRHISKCLSVGNMSAYIWWKLIGNANGLLNAEGTPQCRAYVMGQFSRFVRPGDQRIAVAGNASALEITAFKRPGTGNRSIVAVNATTEAITQAFDMNGVPASHVSVHMTDATHSLALVDSFDTSGEGYTYTIPAWSVVTFSMEEIAAESPVITAEPSSLTVIPGGTIELTASAQGVPSPTIRWWKNGVEVPSTNGVLRIDSASTGNEGEYSFTATNVAGTVTSHTILVGVRDASARTERMVNVSTRGDVISGGSGLIVGFAITGEVPVRVLIRGIGKTLEGFGVTGALQDTQLVLNQVSPGPNRVIASNDNWGSRDDVAEIQTAAATTGAFALPANSSDSCILIWLRPGIYTATLTGVGDSAGNAMVEAYSVPAK